MAAMIILGIWTVGILIVHGMGGFAADALYIVVSMMIVGSWDICMKR